MGDFQNLKNARKVIDQRAIDNRKKNIDDSLKYRIEISKTKEEKIACETILNSNLSIEDKEYLFNGGLFRTDEELEVFEREKKKEQFIESGEWEKLNQKKGNWAFLIPFTTLFTFFCLIMDSCTNSTLHSYSSSLSEKLLITFGLWIIPSFIIAFIIKSCYYNRIVNKAKELNINDDLARKAQRKKNECIAGAVAIGVGAASAGAKQLKKEFDYHVKK